MGKFFATVLIAGLASCSSPEISVKEKWADSVRNYALVPVYPMREDVFIGDVRVHSTRDIKDDAFSLNSRLLTHWDVDRIIEKRQKLAPSYPKSTSSQSANEPVAWPQPTGSITASNTADRLRLAALPKIDLLRLTGAQLSAGGASGAFSLLGGLGAESEQTLIVSVSAVETLELPDLDTYTIFVSQLPNMFNLADTICAAGASFGDPDLVHTRISLVTRVIYTREINYAFGDTFTAAAKLSIVRGLGSFPNAVSPGNNANNQPPQVDLTTLASQTTPGVSASITRVSKDGLSLQQVFERPLAFGIDVLSFSPEALGVNPDNCQTSVVPTQGNGPVILTGTDKNY